MPRYQVETLERKLERLDLQRKITIEFVVPVFSLVLFL